MTLALCLLAAVALAAVIVLGAIAGRSSLTTGPSVRGETIAAHTRGPEPETIRGVVVAHHADRLILRDAVLELGQDARAPIPGLAEIPTASLSWWQRVDSR